MSSRQEEKERRRREREEAEARIKAAEARKKRLGMVAGGVLAAAAVAAAVVAIFVVAGGDDDGGNGPEIPRNTAPIPGAVLTDLSAATRAAKCQLLNPKNEGSTHTSDKVTYTANPPTSGNHHPDPAQDGVYVAGNEPAMEHLVHALEHGRIEFQYKPGTPARRISQLETLFSEKEGYHALVFQNPTGMKYAVAATSWDHSLVCPTFNNQVFDAFRAFREQYTDKAPEFVP